MKKLFVLFVFGIFVLGLSMQVLAQAETDNSTGETILETGAGTLPDSPFYGLKRFGEGIQSFFTFDQIEKAKLKYKLAQLRLAEAETMARLNKIQLAENALREYEAGLNETEADENTISAAGRNTSAIADLVGNNTYRHILVLQKVYQKVPESAKPAIRAVLEKSMERQSKIAGRIADMGNVNITISVDNQTITRQVPAKLAEKFLEKAREVRGRTGEGVEIEDDDVLKEKIAEKIEITRGKATEQITDTKEKLADLESKITADTNITALARIISEAKAHLDTAEVAFSQNNFREAYRHAILAEKAAKVAERIIEKAENIEKIIAEKLEIRREKAQEQIADAKKQINITGQKMINITNAAAGRLLANAKEHLSKAETAFNNTKYGEAFGQAVAAEQLAKNAERLIIIKEKAAEKREEIKETVKERIEEKKEEKKVEITASGFSPRTLTINSGETVAFINKDSSQHWPASAVHPTHAVYPEPGGCTGSKFDACKGLAQGENFSFVFSHNGTWTYHDHLNTGITGTIIVKLLAR